MRFAGIAVTAVVCLVGCTYAEEFRITSAPQVIEAKLNDIVTLPCEYVGRPDGIYRLWFHDQNVISVDEKIIYRREDFTLDGSFLKVNVSKPELADKYICKFNDPAWSNVTHRILLLGAPVVEVDNKVIDTREGSTFSIHCTSSSAPKPNITYTKIGSDINLSPFVKDEVLQITQASRKHAGIYKCTAQNGYAPDGEQTIEVRYEGRPDVSVAIQWHNLNSESEKSVEITCKVSSEVPVKVQWRKGPTDVVRNTNHFQITEKDGVSTLRINRITKELFDNYTCLATNSYGEGSEYVEISSLPIRPIVTFEPTITEVEINLTTVSPYRVRAFRLNLQGPTGEVTKTDITFSENAIGDEDGKYTIKHRIDGLVPATTYTGTVEAITENDESSAPTSFTFTTAAMTSSSAQLASSLALVALAAFVARN